MEIQQPQTAWIKAGIEAVQQARDILQTATDRMRDTDRIEEQGRETKIIADQILHETIAETLSQTGLPVRSEEGDTACPAHKEWCWVIDPLDGSANFQRGFSLCATSIALCYGMQPVTGFVYDLHTREIITGGAGVSPATTLRCASTATLDRAILCTGIPARLQWSPENTALFSTMFQNFYKIRMLGSAVQALLHVATGKADVYFERNIMFWDVAAAWAIAETTGIQITTRPGTRPASLQLLAAPPALMPLCTPMLMPEHA
ncbi:MAG: inositol monophosphatase family protein [Kiritimatiellia bacterium]